MLTISDLNRSDFHCVRLFTVWVTLHGKRDSKAQK